MNFDAARKIADAVLYEGYVLYPYRKSSAKNRFRWQFGIVAPHAWSEEGGEAWEMQTECLIEPAEAPAVEITVRFLLVGDPSPLQQAEWDEGVERTIELETVALEELLAAARDVPFGIGPIHGLVRLTAQSVDGFMKLRVRIENLTECPAGASRSEAIRRSLVGAHTLLGVAGGGFISLTDPPPEAASAARTCVNLHTWPVLVGTAGARDVLLSSPIILQDYPAIAPESHGEFCDATEIDEILTLRVMALTEEEKREACATDGRARAIIERCDSIPPEIFERLHGAIRGMKANSTEEFFNPPGEEPETARVSIAGGEVFKGTRVRIAPKRMADSMDLFLTGRTAIVAGVHRDVENKAYVAVTVEDDPAADVQGRVGRFFYFYPDELELVRKEL